ncbi:MAG: leucyl/phenylalanyl-tRNA--protein transferase [Bacteroidetes bacterium]|nr:leucyl/phenylalanyl-tRNA--protein transferase [Bacteroidota bacterium]
MPVYRLDHTLRFPSPHKAMPGGLLAVGGDLSVERLIAAYSRGIFPWSNPGEPLLWWSPDPRMMMLPGELYVTKSMRKIMRDQVFDIRFDTSFEDVIMYCARSSGRAAQGTWISDELRQAFVQLHRLGLAHSVEAWKEGQLVGGLYGLALGACFFGESMFYLTPNASKAAFIGLVKFLESHGFMMIDAQQETPHLASLGAKARPRSEFLMLLADALKKPTLIGKWNSPAQDFVSLTF